MKTTRCVRLTGNSIKAERKRRRMTLQQFAEMIGVSWTTVCRWETGRTKPSRMAVAAIKRVVGDR